MLAARSYKDSRIVINRFEGTFHLPTQTTVFDAWINFLEDGQLQLVCPAASIEIIYLQDQYVIGDAIPGLPLSVYFLDDSVFTPKPEQQNEFKASSRPFRKGKLIEWFERRRKALLFSLLLIPTILFSAYKWGIPILAHNSAAAIPYALQKQVGDETFFIIDKANLSDSALPQKRQEQIENQWRKNLDDLEVQNRETFTLFFKQSEAFKNNAFALTNRSIVITDSLIKTLEEDDAQIQAVLLHETGHVVHLHGVKKLLESVYVTVFTSLLIGDVQGLGDVFVSLGTGVANSAFSRDMEREADAFAINSLRELGISPQAFATAMQKISHRGESKIKKRSWIEELFSSHPDTQERIESAK